MITIIYSAKSDTLTEALRNCIDLNASTGMIPDRIEGEDYNVKFNMKDAKAVTQGKIKEEKYIDLYKF